MAFFIALSYLARRAHSEKKPCPNQNPLLQNLAFSSLKEAPWSMAYYQKHKAMGKKHSHVLRCLANLHLRILFTMWKNRSCYDENLFLAQRARNQITNQKKLKI